ncbi:hypothetical protein [Candidatus Methanoprimaticola sp. MG2]|uniref:hypothetical protein n=1 Tax=Candidatus Methanoprimaticola sp. MG2 TaxID=3228838 RepID=UPI0039C6A15A
MSDSDSGSGRKRILVPIVAIMMCAVAIIGVGYSLTSTVSSNDNPISGDGLELSLYSSNTGGDTELENKAIFGDGKIPYSVNTVTEKNGSAFKTTKEYKVEAGIEVKLNYGNVYLGINKTPSSSEPYTITMTYNVYSAPFSEIRLYTGDGATLASDIDSDPLNGLQFEITEQYTKIELRGITSEYAGDASPASTVDVNFSVTSA